MYQQRIGHGLWLVGRNSNGKENYKSKRELEEKTRKIIWKSPSASPALWRFISLSILRGRLIFHTLFLSSSLTIKKDSCEYISVLANWWIFVCSSMFLNVRLQRGSDRNLRRSFTLIDYLERWCYICLCCSVALQTSVENRDGTGVLIKNENYIINFFFRPHTSPSSGVMIESKLYLSSTLMYFTLL